ncbi:MAG: hypothetical protein ABIB93_00710 [Chloroflexota bacterium]
MMRSLLFARKTIDEGWHVRFIELMAMPEVGDAGAMYLSAGEMMKRIEVLGKLESCQPEIGNGPARYYRLPGAAGTIGFITPVSEHFCRYCNRLRLTSDGKLHLCLLSQDEVDLRGPLRSGISFGDLKILLEEAVAKKPQGQHVAGHDLPNTRPMSRIGG